MSSEHPWKHLVAPVTVPTAHLEAEELALGDLSADAQKHLADCAWCRQRKEAVTAEDQDELADLLTALEGEPVASAALEAAQSLPVPEALRAYVSGQGAVPAVAPAQLWNLQWHGVGSVGVVVEQASWWVTVAPLSTDVDFADEYTLLAGPQATSFGCDTAVFMRAVTTVPAYTLSRYLGDLRPAGAVDSMHRLRGLYTAYLGQTTPAEPQTGPSLQADDWDRQAYIDSLSETMSWFASASSEVLDANGDIVGGDGPAQPGTAASPTGAQVSERGKDRQGTATDLVDLLQAAAKSKGLATLAGETGLPPARLLNLLQRRARPTPPERATLEKHFGVAVRAAHPQNARLALLELISEPSHRHLWSSGSVARDDEGGAARRGGEGTGAGLRAYLESAFDQALAARSTSSGGQEPDSVASWRTWWEHRLAMDTAQ